MVVARAWGEVKNEQLLFNEYGVLVWEDEKVLKKDGDDGCTTI